MQNIIVMHDIVSKFVTFDTDGQHSTWRYDKKDYCSFTIAHFPQNSIIPTAPRMEFIFHTSTATLELAVYIQTFQRHRILSIKLLNQECLKNRLILFFKDLFVSSFTNICTK